MAITVDFVGTFLMWWLLTALESFETLCLIPASHVAFESANALLCCTPVLTVPDFIQPFKLEVDTSAFGIGTVLLQEDEQAIDHPICYFSKKLNKHQINYYSTIEKRKSYSAACLTAF